jgi:hypothetical protein
MVPGSLFSWNTSWLLFHAMKKGRVANFHGQASDAYAHVWTVQGSLFSWITQRIKAKTSQHNFFITWDRSREVFHEYKLPCICPVYDIGFKVLSMKINYLAWKTSWLLSNETKEWEVANFHGQTSDAYAYVWMVPGSLFSWNTSWLLFHAMPCICPVYDIGFKVLSMKINYLAPFKHEHKHLKLVHEN